MPYPHGLFSWSVIGLPDPAGGTKFYTELFGWTATDINGPDGEYRWTMFSKAGDPVAGLTPSPLDGPAPFMAPMWTAFVSVDDLDEAVSRWTAEGGTVLSPPSDVTSAGRRAIVADPEGAVLALWEAGDHRGAEVFGERRTVGWNELNTRNSAKARRFYGTTLGWGFEQYDADSPPTEYWMIILDHKPAGHPYANDNYNGGILTMDEQWPDEIPAHWMVYFTVEDTDRLVERLTELGGTVSVPPFDTSAGRIAVVGDPQGGTFSIIAPEPA